MARSGMLLEDATFIAFDTETTGLHPVAAELVEIGAVCFRLDGEEISVFEQLIDPGMSIPPDAQAVNHITDEMVSGQPTIGVVLPEFLDFLGGPDNILIAHNAKFDMDFIGIDLIRMGLPLPQHMVFDTIMLGRSLAPGLMSYNLQALSGILGVATGQDHRALSDARLTKDVFRALLRRDSGVNTITALAASASPQAFGRTRIRQVVPPRGYERLVEAITRRVAIEIVYEGGTRGEEPRAMTPHAFLRAGGFIYLAGRCHIDGKNKMYRLDRIKTYRVL